MKLILTFFFLIGAAFGQVPISTSSGSVTINADMQYTISTWMTTKCFSGVQTTLATALDNVSTSFTLASGTGLGSTSVVLVDGGTANAEVIQLGTKTNANVTGAIRAIIPASGCAAGALCTTAIAHAVGASVQELCIKGNSTPTAQKVFDNFSKYVLLANFASMQQQVGNPTIAAQQAIIATAQAAIAAAIAAAAQ